MLSTLHAYRYIMYTIYSGSVHGQVLEYVAGMQALAGARGGANLARGSVVKSRGDFWRVSREFVRVDSRGTQHSLGGGLDDSDGFQYAYPKKHALACMHTGTVLLHNMHGNHWSLSIDHWYDPYAHRVAQNCPLWLSTVKMQCGAIELNIDQQLPLSIRGNLNI